MSEITINIEQLLHSAAPVVYSTEASDLGLAPGDWPAAINVVRDGEVIRCASPVPLMVGRGEDREVAAVQYTAPGRFTVKIWND